MIDLTVKTLDSQNHGFSLADDITVREFKEHIAETVSVPADSQRLIYCGRVLQDEKHLSEYDVNGKVIHLVQRAPPQSAQRGNSGGQSHGQNRSRGDQPQAQRMRYRQTRTQFHGNPMYLGSFSIPAEVVDGHEWPIAQLSNTLSNSRLVVARRMLDLASRVIDRLENPSAAAANDAAASERDEAASGAAGAAATEATQQDQEVNRAERLLQRLSGPLPMGGIIEFATAIAGSGRAPYVWPMRAPGDESGEPSAPSAEPTSEESQAEPQEQQQRTPRQGGPTCGNDQPGNARPSPSPGSQGPRSPQMAQLLGRLMETYDRLRPFLTRYRELMELDPEIPGGHTASGEDIGTVEDNQRLTDGVTECLHFLSHANHALSDIIVDVGQQPPRNLRCRPMVIQHSAILQAGIPIQVEAHISVARNDGSNGESGEESGDATSRPPTSATATPPASQNPIDLTFVTDQSDQTPPTAGQQQSEQQQQQQQQAQSQPQVDSPFGAIFNITNNMEVLMEMGPPDSNGSQGGSGGNAMGTEQSQTAGGNNNNNNNTNNNNNNAPGTSGIFPWGPAPPPEVFRNLLHVVAGYMAQNAATGTTVAATTSTPTATTCVRQRVQVGVGSGGAPNPGQSTQARSNVGTHPTTSTQTRSTARPHVFHPHAHPLGVGMGMGQNLDFDPFLPCNSHHIRRTPSATPTNTAATSSPQQTAQPSQSTTPNGAGQTQPDAPTAPTERTSSQPTSGQPSTTGTLREEIAKLRGTSNGQSDDSTTGESERAPTLEDLLIARGITNVLRDRESSDILLLQYLFTICSRIEVSEWFAYLETGSFTRDDVWRRLRPHITCMFMFCVAPMGSPDLAAGITEQTVTEFRPYYADAFDAEERQTNIRNGRRIDLPATLESMVHPYIQVVTLYIEENVLAPCDDEWGAGLIRILKDFVRELVSILLFSLRREYAGLESVIRYVSSRAMAGQHSEFRDWILGSVVEWLCEYCRHVERLPNSDIIPSLVYKDAEEVPASNVNIEGPRPQETQSQPEPEPMETEEASGNRTINDPLDLADGEEVPTTFPGHEALLPEWVPIIARDGTRQRRQLQLQGGGVTAFSDAYLDGLPSKRRKLVEQQKPPLLVSPTPNHSSISASMERLVRVNVVRAGVAEAEGAAAAVAADPGVRRAFGQAIRDCLNPRRLQTPDFPDARRFPNATKYFANKDSPSKQ